MEAQVFDISAFMVKLYDNVVNPLIVFFFAAAVVFFLWGVADFIRSSESDDGREKGKQHMVWGVVGIFLMTAVFAIMCLLARMVGADSTITDQIPACFR